MESLTDYGHIGMDNGIKVHHFLQGIKSAELKAAINVVWVQPEMYGMDFDATVRYLGQMVMKKGSSMQSVQSRKLIMPSTLKRLWDDCLELESNIMSNTAHCIYKLDGEVPQAKMSGEISNMSQVCEFEWFEWVMF